MVFYDQMTLAFLETQLEEESKPDPDLGQPRPLYKWGPYAIVYTFKSCKSNQETDIKRAPLYTWTTRKAASHDRISSLLGILGQKQQPSPSPGSTQHGWTACATSQLFPNAVLTAALRPPSGDVHTPGCWSSGG